MFGLRPSNDKPIFVKELSHYPIKCLNEADAENMLGWFMVKGSLAWTNRAIAILTLLQ